MLNYIWLGLIVVAIFVAVGRDVSEESSDRFRNNETLALHVAPASMKAAGPNHFIGSAFITKAEAAHIYGVDEVKTAKGDTIAFAADLIQSQSNPKSGTLTLTLPSNAPSVMTDASASGGD